MARYRGSAKAKGLPFELTEEEFQVLTSANCHYCGTTPRLEICFNNKPYTTYTFNGIDRKDNSSGYTAENSVSCCHACNSCKGARSYAEFLDLVTRIYTHRLTRLS